jgi:murein DD-endopeptidase MepM/ murein hydrolase activator NlpD
MVKPGQHVVKNQVIALSGKSGGVSPHLHFEILLMGKLRKVGKPYSGYLRVQGVPITELPETTLNPTPSCPRGYTGYAQPK